MTIDDRLASYLRARYDALVGDAALLCAEPRDAEAVVATTLARLVARPRRLRRGISRAGEGGAPDGLDTVVRRRLVRACIADDRRHRRDARGGSSDIHVMQVVVASDAVQSGPTHRVRRALSDLPPRQRVALVMRYLEGLRDVAEEDGAGARDERVAGLLGWPVATVGREAYAGLAALADVLGVDTTGAASGFSQTEALLRRALHDAPTHVTRGGDPALAVTRRARTLQRRRAVVTAGVAAAVIIVGAQVLSGGSDSVVTPVSRVAAATPPAPPRLLAHAASAHPSGVVAGAGSLWTIELHPSGRRAVTVVERRDVASGRVERSYRVPGEDFGIAYGLGRVWTWGAGVSRQPSSDVSSINPANSTVRTVTIGSGQVGDVAFAAGRAWFTQAARNRVVALAPGLNRGKASYRANGATDVAAYGPNSVVVLGSGGALLELPIGVTINHNDPSLTFLSATSQYGVWIGHGGQLTYSPAIDSPLTVSLRLSLRVALVVGDPQTGVYVVTTSMNPLHYDPYLVYYSPAAMLARRPRPTTTLSGLVKVDSLTADPQGGVDFVTTEGVIARWNPAASPLASGAAAPGGSLR